MDPDLDREYVGWRPPAWNYKAKGYPAPFFGGETGVVQVIGALRRALKRHGRPVTAAETLRELWGQDWDRADVSSLGVWLAFHGQKAASVQVERSSGAPNRYTFSGVLNA